MNCTIRYKITTCKNREFLYLVRRMHFKNRYFFTYVNITRPIRILTYVYAVVVTAVAEPNKVVFIILHHVILVLIHSFFALRLGVKVYWKLDRLHCARENILHPFTILDKGYFMHMRVMLLTITLTLTLKSVDICECEYVNRRVNAGRCKCKYDCHFECKLILVCI